MAYSLVRFILWSIAVSLFRIRVTGAENIPRTGGGLLVSNHISYADSVLVGYTTKRAPHFLMWQPIYDFPVANYFFRLLHAIPIDSESPKGIIRAIRAARAELQKGELVVIFAEGQITRNGELGPFERGYEKVLDGNHVPIIPIYIDGLWGHPLSARGGAAFRSWQKLWRPVVNIRIGEPVWEHLPPEKMREAVLRLSTGPHLSSPSPAR